ncbi:MAG TPA: aminoacyl-tRNA hydrolase [Opitutae bacterium]|nr:aminoacyl-tRNA hydrolase [Opitutae bacterium]|tara:strand:- start:1245 stop:1838 length:594 start_codon:yes stop_codon:yes gene_type:complete
MEKLAVIGLGNPGPEYEKSRHNLGFWLLDALAEREDLRFKTNNRFHAQIAQMERKSNKYLLIKPMTFMNDSGRFLSSLLSYFGCASERSVVVHDEMAFPLAHLKISQNKGDGGHNGVKSVVSAIGSSLVRFRIGIGTKPDSRVKLSDFVLSDLNQREWEYMQDRSDYLCRSLLDLLDQGVDATMNAINQTHPSTNPL